MSSRKDIKLQDKNSVQTKKVNEIAETEKYLRFTKLHVRLFLTCKISVKKYCISMQPAQFIHWSEIYVLLL